MARIGKIARLPDTIREELNKRIRGGQLGTQTLPWLNSLPDVVAVCQDFFGGQPINDQNLSAWRNGGYKEWEEKQDTRFQRLERIRELSRVSMELARANGGSLSEGAASMLGGSILEVLEGLDQATGNAEAQDGKERLQVLSEAIENLTLSVSRLRKGDQGREAIRLTEERIRQKDDELKLAREQFDQRLKEYQDKVAEQKRAIQGELVKARDGGITPDTLAKIEEAAKLL